MMHLVLSLILTLFINSSLAQDKSTCTGPTANVVTCNDPIKEFKCDEDDAVICNGTMIDINYPIKDFYIKAEDDNIAMDTTFNVYFNDREGVEPVNLIEGVIAGGDESLLSSTVVITNNQFNETLCIKKLELNGDWSGDGFTLMLVDGADSAGIKLEEIKCGDNGLACTLKSSAMGETPEGATSNCRVITSTETLYCLDLYNNEDPVVTDAVPDYAIPSPARSNLQRELDHELQELHELEAGNSNNDGDEKDITVSLSSSAMANLWAMIGVFLIVNAALFICWNNKKMKSNQRVIDEI